MKIDKVTLNNLTSFEGLQTIDFTTEPLRSAGLFAITGDTGAGKSTLLDAICLALYGRAPRLDGVEKMNSEALATDSTVKGIQTDDVRNIMRRGQKEASALVEFSTPDGARYEAAWSCRKKRTGNYDTVARTFRQIAPKKKSFDGRNAEIQEEINRVVGLDYMQFSRTVMLAQNSFASFLKARKEEKSALLEKLTGTEIYGRISMRIHEKAAAATARVKTEESHIEGILHNRLTPEELEDLETDVNRLILSEKQLCSEQEMVKSQINWLVDFAAAEAKVKQLEEADLQARRAREAMRTDQLRLRRFDELQPVQQLYRDIVLRRSDVDRLQRQGEALYGERTEAKKTVQAASAALATAREQEAAALAQLQQQLPGINRGRQLSGEITGKEETIKRLEHRKTQAEVQLHRQCEAHAAKLATIEMEHKEEQELQVRYQALSTHRVMFDKIELIKDKLNSFDSETAQHAENLNATEKLQRILRDISGKLEETEKEQNEKDSALSVQKSELLMHRQANKGLDGAQLQQKLAEESNRVNGLRHAARLWTRIANGYEELDERRAKIARDATNLDQLKKSLERLETEAATAHDLRERRRQAYILSNSENIEILRHDLREGAPCPVCGATHHPYHTETERELGELISNLETDYNEACDLADAKLRQLDDLRLQMARAESELTLERNYFASLEAKQKADEEEWQTFAALDKSFKDCSPTVNRQARTMMIELLLENTQRAAEEDDVTLKTFNFHQGFIDRLTIEVERLENQVRETASRLGALKTERQVRMGSLEDVQARLRKSERITEALYVDLDEMITLSGWFSEWKHNAENFRRRIVSLYDEWLYTTNKLEEKAQRTFQLGEELKSVEEAEAEANRHLEETVNELSMQRNELSDMQEEMRRLVGKDTPAELEARLNAFIRKTQQETQTCIARLAEANDRLNRLDGRHENVEQALEAGRQEYNRKSSEMDLWILKFNGTHTPTQFSEMEILFTDTTDWNAIRAEIARRDEACLLAAHNADKAREDFIRLKALPGHPSGEGEESIEALQEGLQLLQSRHEALSAELLQLQSRLKAHYDSEAAAAKRHEALRQLEEDATEWGRLDDLLGSSTGKKFRELAQSYTFRLLVAQANHHLSHLSARYRLVNIPGTLTLEIEDRDMFDERRYVSSLSGGETFVVCLALALGLASLSAHNLSIGSLFIDEGFGNLDQASLNLVMEALSNLETIEGRKVGVISHTDQIRRQISPQIQVRKLPVGGRSEIVVV